MKKKERKKERKILWHVSSFFQTWIKGLWPYGGWALPTPQMFLAVGLAWKLPHPVSIEQL
jgi:hypothetical protein